MAQRLLENRFGLVLTREQRAQEVYLLRLARADGRMGPDVRRAPDDCLAAIAPGGVPTILTDGVQGYMVPGFIVARRIRLN